MKTWIILFATAVFAGGASLGVALDRNVLAQPQYGPRETIVSDRGGYEMSVTRFADELGLSDDQNEQLDAILSETKRDIEAYKRAQRAAADKSRERVTAILTPEQKKKLDELVAAERKKKSEREIERMLKMYTSHLTLTEAQQPDVRAIIVESQRKRRDFFAQGRPSDHAQIRAWFKALYEDETKRLEKVLTPEQMKKHREVGTWWE